MFSICIRSFEDSWMEYAFADSWNLNLQQNKSSRFWILFLLAVFFNETNHIFTENQWIQKMEWVFFGKMAINYSILWLKIPQKHFNKCSRAALAMKLKSSLHFTKVSRKQYAVQKKLFRDKLNTNCGAHLLNISHCVRCTMYKVQSW